jgi:hypothetical protein
MRNFSTFCNALGYENQNELATDYFHRQRLSNSMTHSLFIFGKLAVAYHCLPLWLYSLLDLGRFFSFLILYTVGRTLWTGDQPVVRPLPTHNNTNTV